MWVWLWFIQMLIGVLPPPPPPSLLLHDGTSQGPALGLILLIGLCPSIGRACGVFPLTLGMSLAKKTKEGQGPLMGQTLSEVGGGVGDCGGSQMLVLWKLSM